jgi:hypothetical protein
MFKATGPTSVEEIVLLDKDELQVMIEYLKKDINIEEEKDLEKALEFYMNHRND